MIPFVKSDLGNGWFFDTYHRSQQPRGRIYFSYLVIGLLSLLSRYVLIVAGIFWLLGVLGVKQLSPRSWLASLLGILTPYWILLGIGSIH